MTEEDYGDNEEDFNDLPNIEGLEDELDEDAFMDCGGEDRTHSSDSSKRRRVERERVSSVKIIKH